MTVPPPPPDPNLEYIINHLFLPPKLPHADDWSVERESVICERVIHGAKAFASAMSSDATRWEPVVRMLENLRLTCATQSLNKKQLQSMISGLSEGDTLIIPVRAQNACIIARRLGASTIYESFEIDPPNEKVMETTSRLVRTFPGPALEVADTVASSAFHEVLSVFLTDMDAIDVRSIAITKKVGAKVTEVRDTTNPHLIIQLLPSILHGFPESKPADIERIEKRVRNEIIWEAADAPWRRSPLWLVIRVALQSTLRRSSTGGQTEFKAFIIFLLVDVVLSCDDIHSLSTDVLVCMQNKIIRRLRKLSDAASGSLIEKATEAMKHVKEVLEARRKHIKSHQTISLPWSPESIDVTKDTKISLLSSKQYLSLRLQRPAPSFAKFMFTPSETCRLNEDDILVPATVRAALSQDPFVALADLEEFAVNRLDAWVELHRSDPPSTCVALGETVIIYAQSAQKQYHNPEDRSLMLLAIFLLWSALDRLTISQHPSLADYSPEIREDILDPILLRKHDAIEGLFRLRQYLSARHTHARYGSVFSDELSSSSFSIRHFAASASLRALKQDIESKAQAQRDAKRQEFERLKWDYENLIRKAQQMEHKCYESGYYRPYCCPKCRTEREANELKLDVHEWPLPPEPLAAQATVFELHCPIPFQTWRTTTYTLLFDYCRPGLPKGHGSFSTAEATIANYSDLNSFCKNQARITYASSTKPFLRSHYSSQKIAHACSDGSSILVNNGLHYSLFDTALNRWVRESFQDCAVEKLCYYSIPSSSPYYALQYAMQETTHSTNRPIADQADVLPELSIHEHLAFGTVRSGPVLQWLNILREIRARTLSFDRFEVHLLCTQGSLQTGSIKGNKFEWHEVLDNADFGRALLSELEGLISSVESNWRHINTLQTVIVLASRLLACSLQADVVDRACSTLRTASKVAFSWVNTLIEDLEGTIDEATSEVMRQRVCMAAVTCRFAYDVDRRYFDRLISDDDSVRVLVQCAVLVQDCTPLGNVPADLSLFLARDRRLSWNLAPALWERIKTSRKGLDNSLHAIWSAYKPGLGWQQLFTPNERWLTSTISIMPGVPLVSTIHYNLLNGSFLIDGKPLGRLPSSIVQHPTYKRLLGHKILDVVPSTLPTMDFSTRSTIFVRDLFLHFQLPDGNGNLIIQAEVGSNIFELIPDTVFEHRSFGADFPLSFITNYVHWLCLSSGGLEIGHVEFHPINDKWKPSKENWDLSFTAGSATMTGGDSMMVDIRSDTFRMVTGRLGPLEASDHIHAMIDKKGILSVDLPRFKLTFFVNEDTELECSTIRNMMVDHNQSSGAMFGLMNQLVLRDKSPRMTRIAAPGHRRLIIPFGRISFQECHYHHNVRITPTDGVQKFFVYEIDSTLERLTGTTFLSELFKIYLHACTSFPITDDLTGRTGTEEALHTLESARCFSFKDLTNQESSLLHEIARLTPGTEWYPSHLKVMQTIHWSKIDPLAQHWAFATRVDDIFQFHEQLTQIGIGILRAAPPIRTQSALLARLDSRTSGLYAAARKPLPPHSDIIYTASSQSRIGGKSEGASLLAANVSAFVRHPTGPLDTVPDLWERLEAVNLLRNYPDESISYRTFLSPSLTDLFLPFYELCRKTSGAVMPYMMAFICSTLGYVAFSTKDELEPLIPTFLSFARLPDFRCIDPPSPTDFDLGHGLCPSRTSLVNLLEHYKLPFPDNQPPRRSDENEYQYDKRHSAYWQSVTHREIESVVDRLMQQWPCKAPHIPGHSGFEVIDLSSSKLENQIAQHFQGWFNNTKLREFVAKVQAALDRARESLSTPIPSTVTLYKVPSLPSSRLNSDRYLPRTLDHLMHRSSPDNASMVSSKQPSMSSKCSGMDPVVHADAGRLRFLVEDFKQGPESLQRIYGEGLDKSLKSYLSGGKVSIPQKQRSSYGILLSDYELQRRKFAHICLVIQQLLAPQTPFEKAESIAGQWPNPTNASLLRLLSKEHIEELPLAWRRSLVALAQELVTLQHSRRSVILKIAGREDDLFKELENSEYQEDISFSRPEWLLIQIDSNFTVRPVQSRVAQEMISPRSKQNSLTQLSMGEGKSAVIVPLISSHLADGQRLVRVVTLKPLVNQTFNLLVRRLSGLTNRRIFYLPFSRDFNAQLTHLGQLQMLYTTCVKERGILLIQPEHILSFRLTGIDLASEDRVQAAESLLSSHRWLTSVARDILDESDEILQVTYQLVYTSGLQAPMDSHPDRWTIIQEIIGYAIKHAASLHHKYPNNLEVQNVGEIGPPIIRILDSKAGVALIDAVVSEVLKSERFSLLPAHIWIAASDFVRCHRINPHALENLRSFLQGSRLWKHILLYRGLLGHGLLRFVLQERRWRVDYGLDPSRTLLAVPYRAKDLPSLRADFGHPDVALMLTCLSYYYGGLTEEQLDHCFELLFKLDDPPLEYNQWVLGQDQIPPSFRDIKGVNLDDHNQRKLTLGPLFKRNKAVVDFYLSNVVFPRYAKQFPQKLSTSSWDLAETKNQVITGFSGTNDNRYLLPTSIQQYDTTAIEDRDPFGQLATNAKVLNILLQLENDNYYCLCGKDGQSPTGSDYLELLVKQTPPVRVLLDVGAQMLDMQNTELVSKWMSLAPEFQAIVFFNEADELVVMSRDGHIEKFVSSQFNQKLDLCAVYLDDAHTRGTDLKLPNDFRAVVTLGPKLVKDRLVQGCMRMRQLGRGQSVIFFAPLEVDRNIRACTLFPLEGTAQITSADILRWSMWNTCEHIRHYLPHWAQQGVEYKRRNDAWILHESDASAPNALQTLRSSWEEPDARTLEEMYEEQPNLQATSNHPAFQLPYLRERLDYLGVTDLGNPKTDEEQERQVAKEAERERQRELPLQVQPATSNLHEGLSTLVQSGTFSPEGDSPFVPLFSPLDTQHKWSVALFSTRDFVTTIKDGKSTGDYLRPVNWILSVPAHQVLILISPFEANALLPAISKSKHVHLHIYTPRVNKNMKSTEDLRFFSVPALPASTNPLSFITEPMIQLNIWAGQLYLKDFETYKQLCRVLGLVGGDAGAREWDSDGFVKPENRTGAMKEQCQMVVSPVVFVKELFSLRRKGMGYEQAHMGKILNARPLQMKDFEE